MIVQCPRCQISYQLPYEVINSPRANDQGGTGWHLSCGSCDFEWWQKASPSGANKTPHEEVPLEPDYLLEENLDSVTVPQSAEEEIQPTPYSTAPLTADFNNYTNIQGLYVRPEDKSEIPENTLRSPSNFMRGSQSSESIPYKPRISPHKSTTDRGGATPPPQTKSRKGFLAIFLIISVTLMTMGLIIYAFQQSKEGEGVLSRLSSVSVPKPQNLVIRDVKYSTQEVGERKTILVVGEVFNPNKKATGLNPLKITIWGPCPQEQMVVSPDKNGSCLIASWNHEWDRSVTGPGERILFQTVGSVPSSQIIDRVDVTLP